MQADFSSRSRAIRPSDTGTKRGLGARGEAPAKRSVHSCASIKSRTSDSTSDPESSVSVICSITASVTLRSARRPLPCPRFAV